MHIGKVHPNELQHTHSLEFLYHFVHHASRLISQKLFHLIQVKAL